MLKKAEPLLPFNRSSIVLYSLISKAFGFFLKRKYRKHFKYYYLIIFYFYFLLCKYCTSGLFHFSLNPGHLQLFGKSFVLEMDISKAFESCWSKALISKHSPSVSIFCFICNLLSEILSDRTMVAVVNTYGLF